MMSKAVVSLETADFGPHWESVISLPNLKQTADRLSLIQQDSSHPGTCMLGGCIRGWCWLSFSTRAYTGQGSTGFGIGAIGGYLDNFFSFLSYLSSFSLSPARGGSIQTVILSQRAVTNRPTNRSVNQL